MTLLVFAPLAFAAGLISFTSPCCLPLLPGYLAYIASLNDAETANARLRVRAAIYFVAGFGLVFTALGTAIAVAGGRVARYTPLLVRGSGLILILGGIVTAGVVRMPAVLQREARPGLARTRRGPRGAFVLGAAFAAGWSPCIGPVLASILALAARDHTAGWGAGLLLVYSAGLGMPFVLLAFGSERPRWMVWLRRNNRRLELGGGALLTLVGVLLVAGAWDHLFQPVQRFLADLRWPPI